MTTKPKPVKPVKAWMGVCDGEMYFSRQPDGYKSGSAVIAEVYRFETEAQERWRVIQRVLITPIGPTPKKVVAVSVPMPKDRLYKTVIRNPIGRNPTPKKGKRK